MLAKWEAGGLQQGRAEQVKRQMGAFGKRLLCWDQCPSHSFFLLSFRQQQVTSRCRFGNCSTLASLFTKSHPHLRGLTLRPAAALGPKSRVNQLQLYMENSAVRNKKKEIQIQAPPSPFAAPGLTKAVAVGPISSPLLAGDSPSSS